MNILNKVIIILGQTSTGKSDFAVQIAQKIDGEIISADSRQVYKGMNLGTGKITKKEMSGIPHHLLDIVNPKKVFSVNDYKKLANKKIKDILARGKIPIICGGTGFYIDAVVNKTILPEVEPNLELRKNLSKKSKEQLFEMLKKLDPARAKTIDKNNPIRLIRAIEIAKALGSVPLLRQGLKSSHNSDLLLDYDIIKIGLTLPNEILKKKIYTRLIARIKKGMLREIKNLHKSGVSWKRMEALGLEYRYGALYLQGKLTKKEMIQKINTETWHYAKRQMTWFKRDKDIVWLDIRKINQKSIALKDVKNFLK